MTFSVPSAFAASTSLSIPPNCSAEVAAAAEPASGAAGAPAGGAAGAPQAASSRARPPAATAPAARRPRRGTSVEDQDMSGSLSCTEPIERGVELVQPDPAADHFVEQQFPGKVAPDKRGHVTIHHRRAEI